MSSGGHYLIFSAGRFYDFLFLLRANNLLLIDILSVHVRVPSFVFIGSEPGYKKSAQTGGIKFIAAKKKMKRKF